MEIEFIPMSKVDPGEYITLHSDPLVRKHMPLTSDDFNLEACREWIKGKEKIWEEHGYGPWAFLVDGKFAGWGGLQPEGDDIDLGLVLLPGFWGAGKLIYEEIIRWSMNKGGIPSITILLPPSRTHVKGLLRLGFEPDGRTEIDGEQFNRYRLILVPPGDETSPDEIQAPLRS